MARQLPEDVFTPATPVQEDMYASRRHEDLEDRLESALLERGRQVVLFGDTGVGKTSLLNHLTRTRRLKATRVECGGTFEDMLNSAIGAVATRREASTVTSSVVKGETSGSLVVIKGSVAGEQSSTVTMEPVVVPLVVRMIETLEGAGVRLLFLDNFENLGADAHGSAATRAIAQLLKSLADRADENPTALKAVVAGIPTASEALISLDGATARRTTQIEVSRMPEDELAQILSNGEEKLGLSFAGLARHLILRYSDGFPYYTHLLALHTSRRAMNSGGDEVSLADFDEALEAILAGCDLQLRSAYQRAVETSGEVRARRSILEAIASLNGTEVSFKEIRAAFLATHPAYGDDPTRLNFLSTAIRPLKEEYGILSDRGLPKSTRNAYRFTNPLMRAYVRLRMRKDGISTSSLWDPMDSAPTENENRLDA